MNVKTIAVIGVGNANQCNRWTIILIIDEEPQNV